METMLKISLVILRGGDEIDTRGGGGEGGKSPPYIHPCYFELIQSIN